MKTKFIIICCIALLAPTLLLAQQSINTLVESYSNVDNVNYTKAGKAVIWMVKAAAPKGSMDGVKSMIVLEFKGGSTSSEYSSFRSKALTIFKQSGAVCVANEDTDKGSMEVYMERKESPTEYMMFMHGDDNSEVFMLMEGKLPSSLEK
ncbi:MAG: DUF4252 domain-containing protein [Rikenellaceae bacterium]